MLRFIPVMTVMLFAAYQDIKQGEVSNKLWLYTPIGFWLTVLQLLFAWWYIPVTLFVWITVIPISLIAFYSSPLLEKIHANFMFGGADAKALIMLALSYPLSPIILGKTTPYPFFAIIFSGLFALIYGIASKKHVVKFLPFLCAGMICALLV